MSNVQWIVKLLYEAGLTEGEINDFLGLVYEGLILNQDLESKIAYTNPKYMDAFSLIFDEIITLTNQDLIELLAYIS